MKKILLFFLLIMSSNFAFGGIIPDEFLGEWGVGPACKNSIIIDDDQITDYKKGLINASISKVIVVDSEHISLSASRYYQGAFSSGAWDIILKNNNSIIVKTKQIPPRKLRYCD